MQRYNEVIKGEVTAADGWTALGIMAHRFPQVLEKRKADEVYESLLDLCIELSQASGGFIILKQNGIYKLQLWKDLNINREQKEPIQMPPAIGVVAQYLIDSKPVILYKEKLKEDPWLREIKLLPKELISVPIKTTAGSICVYDKREDSAIALGFTAFDKKLLAICVTMCIKSACNEEKLKKIAEVLGVP